MIQNYKLQLTNLNLRVTLYLGFIGLYIIQHVLMHKTRIPKTPSTVGTSFPW